MRYEEFYETLKDGFNAKELAEAIGTSEGHLNELRRSPNANTITDDLAKQFNLDVNEVLKVVNGSLAKPNLNAIYDFSTKREINLDAIDLKIIAEHKTVRNDRPIVEVGTITKLGKIIKIKKVGNVNMFLCQKDGMFEAYGTKEIMDNLITE